MEYLTRMKEIQNHILEFLDNDEEDQNNFDELLTLLTNHHIKTDKHELKSILYLISKISKNHYRGPLFFDKIKRIINHLKTEIKQTFSNTEIFNFFKKNKMVLLIFIEEEILTFDSNIATKVSKYKDFFYPEINKLQQNSKTKEIADEYKIRRKKGENDSYICELIREDNVEEFSIYYTKKSFSLSMTIEPSIYETNSFLEVKKPTLIEYSAFFGSIQILRFLFQNQVKLTDGLFVYGIHGNNPDIIHFLEENGIRPKDGTYQECLKESIKCHHNDFALYFKNNFINEINIRSNYQNNEISYGFHFYNFQFIPIELNDPYYFFYSVEHDYYKLVEFYKNMRELNINELII